MALSMERERVPDTWFERDYPVLLSIARWDREGRSDYFLSLVRLTELMGKPREELPVVARSVGRLLQGGFIDAADGSTMSGGEDYMVRGLTDVGLRETGAWPKPEDLAEGLERFLEQEAERLERRDPERAHKLRLFAKAAGDLGTDLTAKVAVGIARAYLGF